MSGPIDTHSERGLILAPRGRDAVVAAEILREADLIADVCSHLLAFQQELERGAGFAVLTDEAIRDADVRDLASWIASQPSWSDFPFVLL